jgi:hypothetical protein
MRTSLCSLESGGPERPNRKIIKEHDRLGGEALASEEDQLARPERGHHLPWLEGSGGLWRSGIESQAVEALQAGAGPGQG